MVNDFVYVYVYVYVAVTLDLGARTSTDQGSELVS